MGGITSESLSEMAPPYRPRKAYGDSQGEETTAGENPRKEGEIMRTKIELTKIESKRKKQ